MDHLGFASHHTKEEGMGTVGGGNQGFMLELYSLRLCALFILQKARFSKILLALAVHDRHFLSTKYD